MYGVETFVHPDYQSQGVGSQLMNARFGLLRRLNLRGLVAGSLFVGYQAVAEQMSPEQYVQEVIEGKRFDSNLSKQLRKGFKVRNLIPNYTHEPRTRDYAAAIVWINPDYRPHIMPFPAQPVETRAERRRDRNLTVKSFRGRCPSVTMRVGAWRAMPLPKHIIVQNEATDRSCPPTNPPDTRSPSCPSAPRYAEAMEDLSHLVYGSTRDNPDGTLTAAAFSPPRGHCSPKGSSSRWKAGASSA